RESSVVRGGCVAAAGEGGDEVSAVSVLDRPLEFGGRVVDAGGGNDRLRDQPPARRRAELEQPLVVGAHAGTLQLAVVGVRPRAGQRDAGIEDLRVQAVGVEVAKTRRRVEAAWTDLVVAQPGP